MEGLSRLTSLQPGRHRGMHGATALLLLCVSLLLSLELASAKQSLFQGVLVGNHVPESVLPVGQICSVVSVHYR